MRDKFIKESLSFFLPNYYKGLDKDYILAKVFDKEIQENWKPREGDVIVGSTGNIFVISAKRTLVKELGGDLFFFGGGLCNRDGGNLMNETFCHTMNEDGIWYELGVQPRTDNIYHSSFKDFRYVPYPHEL